jgi:two-component system, OmpR family, sensor histidine kinase MtrB
VNPKRILQALTRQFRRSLQLRAVAATVTFSAIALVLLGGFLSYSIGTGLFNTRLNQVLSESERALVEVQSTFSAATDTDEIALQRLVNSVVPNIEITGSNDSRKVALLRSPGQVTGVVLQSPISADLDTTIFTEKLREQVRSTSTRLSYQSVTITSADGTTHPGIVVGAPVSIPVAGDYELYMVFNLAGEQETLDFVQATLVVGGMVTILIIASISWLVTRRIVRPVQEIARVAEDIADGELDLVLSEKGQDAIAQLANSFNRMTTTLRSQIESLSKMSKMQQRFVSDVSHELRTPMTTIKLAGDFLFSQREHLDGPAKRSAELLHDQIERFEKLLESLLEISRYDAGAVSADLDIHDLNGIVGSAIASLEPLANAKGSKIEIDIPNGAVEAELDSMRIERLLRNLLGNAIEHGQGKPIFVCVGANDKAVAVTVTDYGVGMTRAQVDRVFDRFWRADPSRQNRTAGGTGLGLAISLEDTNLHNGWLQVWARPNEGASFRLTLPRKHNQNFTQSPLPLPPKTKAPSLKSIESDAVAPEIDELEAGEQDA